MIDVYNEVRPILKFDNEDDFYYLQILQRKKENRQLGSNSRVIRNYYIGSVEYLDSRYEEIKDLCKEFNARAMLRLNKRSYEKVAFKTIQNAANCMANREWSFVGRCYDRACGQGHNDPVKKWILDIDAKMHKNWVAKLSGYLYTLEPVGNKVLTVLPTKNGIHVITTPFNQAEFKIDYKEIEVHKDNPINLYIP